MFDVNLAAIRYEKQELIKGLYKIYFKNESLFKTLKILTM